MSVLPSPGLLPAIKSCAKTRDNKKTPRNSRVFFHESSAVGNAKIFKVQGSRKSEHLQVENENYLQPPMVNRPIIECE